MKQRSVYAALVGGAAVAAIFGALLPWARRELIYVSPNDVFIGVQSRSGTDAGQGMLALLAGLLLGALVVWFWQGQETRSRLVLLLMTVPALYLLAAAVSVYADLDGFLASPASELTPLATAAREGLYLTTAAGAVALGAAAFAALRYRPARDRPAPALQAAALPLLLGLPAVIYVVAGVSEEFFHAAPSMALRLQGRLSSGGLDLLSETFRHVAMPLAALGLTLGALAGVARRRVRPAPLVMSCLIVFGYFAFFAFVVGRSRFVCERHDYPCQDPPSYVKDLAVASDEGYAARDDFFLLDFEALGIAVIVATLSVWAGVATVELARAALGRLRRPQGVAEAA